MVKNPPCSAGELGSIPGLGTKIPHAVEKLSPWATNRELVCHSRRPYMPKQGPKEAKQIKNILKNLKNIFEKFILNCCCRKLHLNSVPFGHPAHEPKYSLYC